MLNPVENFGESIIDYQYVECTSSTIQCLKTFTKHYPKHRRKEIEEFIAKGANFIETIQRPDGSWYAFIKFISRLCYNRTDSDEVLT